MRAPRDWLTTICLVLGALALAPGLIAAFHGPVAPDTEIGRWHQRMIAGLSDIRFGSGLRFWLGVAGASAMALLLVYPLRKALPLRLRLGRVAGWFRLHIVIGIAAPVLILYHANFGFGGFNANVALVAMLAIAASGIVGHYIHRRSNAGFHGGVAVVDARRGAVVEDLRQIDGMFAAKSALIERMVAFAAPLTTPESKFSGALRHGLGARRQGRSLEADALWILTQSRQDERVRTRDAALARSLAVGMRTYAEAVRATAFAAVRARLWSGWRLFHLPLFLIMTVGAGLHVAAVWGVDDTLPPTEDDGGRMTPPVPKHGPKPGPKPGPANGVAVSHVSGAATTPPSNRAGGAGQIAWNLPTSDFLAGSGDAGSAVEIVTVRRADVPGLRKDSTTAGGETSGRARSTGGSQPIVPPVPRVRLAAPIAVGAPEPPSGPAAKPAVVAARPPLVVVKPPAVAAVKPVVPDVGKPAVTIAAAEIAPEAEVRRLPEPPPMALGAGAGLPLAQRIAQLKAERFDHSRTKFPLVGKHARVACEACHKKTLEATPTTCISCHKKDDVHRGRRPDCARCHTPENWNKIIKRR